MPVTTPEGVVEYYSNDRNHFEHVLDYLIKPAVEKAGFMAVTPRSKGSDIIHADIIKKLEKSDLVLVDMSVLNPNVFFEMGIRTALNKPSCLIIDTNDEFKVPFDTSIINHHKYESNLEFFNIEEERDRLVTHINESYNTELNYNALWNYFGLKEIGERDLSDGGGSKEDLILLELKSLKSRLDDSREQNFIKDTYYLEKDNNSTMRRLIGSDPQSNQKINRIGDNQELLKAIYNYNPLLQEKVGLVRLDSARKELIVYLNTSLSEHEIEGILTFIGHIYPGYRTKFVTLRR